MQKSLLSLALLVISSSIFAFNSINLNHAPIEALSKFKLMDKSKGLATMSKSISAEVDVLEKINQTQVGNNSILRYQQFYKGIAVVGAEIIITKNRKSNLNANSPAEVNGHLVEDIQLEVKPSISKQDALDLAKKAYFAQLPEAAATHMEQSQLQIRPGINDQLNLSYLVSFKTIKAEKPVWPFFVIDAQTGRIIKQWNNIKTHLDSGPGGNERVKEYWYGKEGLPFLEVKQNNENCIMESNEVKLVNLGFKWDWDGFFLSPYQYPCGHNTEDKINGAFSPPNDAYYFGHVIVDMYKNWYDLPALQYSNGNPMQLVMRVHFGKHYDNAFWDGSTMTFGDGYEFYPLVSLDVAGHEVTHGFTEQHSNLEYANQPGAINESLSDMAGLAARAYLLETNPALYNKSNLIPNKITWGIGETIVIGFKSNAMRYMDTPSRDGISADCYDKALARRHMGKCSISYRNVIIFAKNNYSDPDDQQSHIVHTASGIFNKAFYLLSQKIGIKKAFHAMLLADVKYWTVNTNFSEGACGVINAGKELGIDSKDISTAFNQVGVQTTNC